MNQRRISDVSFVIDRDFNVLDANRSFLFLFNITDFHINIADYIDSPDRENFSVFLRNFSPTDFNRFFIATLKPQDSKITCLFEIKDYQENRYTVELLEFTSAREMLSSALLQNREYSALLTSFDSYYFVYDGSVVEVKSTKTLNAVFADNLDEFKLYLERTFRLDTRPEDNRILFESFIAHIRNMDSGKNYRIPAKDGNMLSITTSEACTRESRIILGLLTGSAAVVVDRNSFTEIKDGLTGLFNKKTITEMAVKKIDGAGEECALIILDLDKFKECNDNYGHAFGDKVLVAVSNAIKEAVEGVGVAGRIGGDEFLLVLDKTSEADVRTVARNIRVGIQWSIPAIEPDSVVTCSMGIARYPMNASLYDELFKIADKCLYIAKDRGRNCYIIYKPEMHDAIFRQQKKDSNEVLSGSAFTRSAEDEMQIIQLLSKQYKSFVPEILDRMISYIGLSKITVYSPETFDVLYIAGCDKTDSRRKILSSSYYRFFNDCGYMHIDNTNIFNTIDKEMHSMYIDSKIASTIEILCSDEDGRKKALMCFDIYKPARSFAKEKIIFIIMAAKMLAKII